MLLSDSFFYKRIMSDITYFFQSIPKIFQTDFRLIAIYIVVYFCWGMLMNAFGKWTKIARFKYWWQVITCYVFYMIPVSLLLKDLVWYQQYAYGLFFMGILEVLGYSLKTSIVYDHNMLDKIFTRTNFALCMTLFFASYFPIGNWLVGRIYEWIF